MATLINLLSKPPGVTPGKEGVGIGRRVMGEDTAGWRGWRIKGEENGSKYRGEIRVNGGMEGERVGEGEQKRETGERDRRWKKKRGGISGNQIVEAGGG